MANTFRKIYKKTGNSGNDADYELIANVGVNGVDLDIMKGASSSTDGELGLVPKPTKEKYKFFLRANGIWDCIYPIGSIYLSINNINPSEYFGGTWVAWGSGRVPVGVSSDSNFNTVEKTGGSSTHSHTISVVNKAAFTSGSTKLSVSQIPSHNHTGTTSTGTTALMRVLSGIGGGVQPNHMTGYNPDSPYSDYKGSNYPGGNHTHNLSINSTGGGQGHTHSIPAHNHTASSNSASSLPPYITCYMWKRTA